MFNGGNKMAPALKAIDVRVVRSLSRFTSRSRSPSHRLQCYKSGVDREKKKIGKKKTCEVKNMLCHEARLQTRLTRRTRARMTS